MKEKQRLFELWKEPKKCKKGCRKTGERKLYRCERKAGNEGCSVNMETGGRTTTRQEVKVRELSSRQRMMRGRGFERTWREDEKGNLFRVAKQLVKRNRDVVEANCLKVSDGKIVEEEDRLMEVWRAHYDVLSNEKFTWDREGLTYVWA